MSSAGHGHARFLTLDALRGVAALAVVAFHVGGVFGVPLGGLNPARGYLAVDLFFTMSGFVIAHSYEGKLATGMSFRRFASIRLVRLYPLYALGTGIGLAIAGASFLLRGHLVPEYQRPVASAGWAAFVLPSPASESSLFPLNTAAWSLFFELVINAIYAMTWRLWTLRICLALAGISAVCLLALMVKSGLPDSFMVGGAAWQDWHVGLLRVFLGFPLGVAIYRVFKPARTLPLTLWLTSLLAVVVVFYSPPNPLADLLIVVGLFPVVVWTAVGSMPPPWLNGSAKRLGDMSYALYATHFPLLALIGIVAPRLGAGAILYNLTGGLLIILICAATAVAAHRWFDRRIQGWLRQRTGAQAASALPARG